MEELEIDAYGECEKMTYYNREDQFLRQRLQKEIPILRALIQNLYEELDRKLHLNGAKVPITFGYDTDTLGSYTRRSAHEKEHFHFSLLFIAYGVKNPLSKEDRIDLFKHEYAHYMQYNMQIPEKYKWQAGTHGSAWKYCCSLIGAAPTPYYKAGEALMNHDYDKVLKNRIHDKSVPVRDTYQQLKTAQKKKDEVVQYKLGDAVTHPKFGHGIVEKINQDLTAKKQTEIAVDTVGAGDGETVIVVGGSSARMSNGKKTDLPVDAAIIGIVDTVEISQC